MHMFEHSQPELCSALRQSSNLFSIIKWKCSECTHSPNFFFLSASCYRKHFFSVFVFVVARLDGMDSYLISNIQIERRKWHKKRRWTHTHTHTRLVVIVLLVLFHLQFWCFQLRLTDKKEKRAGNNPNPNFIDSIDNPPCSSAYVSKVGRNLTHFTFQFVIFCH